MNYKSDFEGAAKSLTSRYAELSRKSEKATLLSRKLPAHTGNPDAAAAVDAVLGEACPVKNIHWEFRDFAVDSPEQASDPLFEAVCALVYQEGFWTGTAGQLLTELQQLDPTLQLKSNALSRSLNDNKRALADLCGITMTRKRQGNQKLLVLTARNGMSDVSD